MRHKLFYRAMKSMRLAACFFPVLSAHAQIQVDLKLPRLQYIAYEPIVAKLTVTNLTGRSIDLRDNEGQTWFGFEITGSENQPITPVTLNKSEMPLNIPAGKTVTQKINLTPLYAVHDFGTYRVRAHVYFADLSKFYYSQTKAFQVTDARLLWQKTVGIPEESRASGNTRTYSLLSSRFPDHTALYVRVEDQSSGAVYATYSLGRIIAFDDPQTELDRANQLHILHSVAPQNWIYSRVSLNGELLAHSVFTNSKTRPHLRRTSNGDVNVFGGTIEASVAESARTAIPNLSARPPEMPKDH